MRAVGVTEVLSALPGPVVVLFALITQFGDVWFTVLTCGLLYWLGPLTPRLGHGLTRDQTAMVVALLAVGIALVASLKGVFELPRPPGAGTATHGDLLPVAVRGRYESMATGDGFGFPSGHATLSLLVWGGFAWALRVGAGRHRTAVAGGVVALVGLSRLVLGVHYLVDVVAGFAVAAAFLALALRVLKTPGRVFGLAAVVAVVGLLAAGVSRDTAGALGLGVGGAVVWALLGDSVPEPTRQGVAVTVALGAVIAGVALGIAFGVHLTPAVVAVLAACGAGGLLALPLAGERLAKKA